MYNNNESQPLLKAAREVAQAMEDSNPVFMQLLKESAANTEAIKGLSRVIELNGEHFKIRADSIERNITEIKESHAKKINDNTESIKALEGFRAKATGIAAGISALISGGFGIIFKG